MKTDRANTPIAETGPAHAAHPHYVITWNKIPTAFGHRLLVASIAYSYADAEQHTRDATVVLGKVIEECLDDPFNRFVFWLSADLNIESTRLDADTRRAIRAELARTVKPPTELQIAQMNMRLNSLPDYLRAFYLEGYFESLIEHAKERR